MLQRGARTCYKSLLLTEPAFKYVEPSNKTKITDIMPKHSFTFNSRKHDKTGVFWRIQHTRPNGAHMLFITAPRMHFNLYNTISILTRGAALT